MANYEHLMDECDWREWKHLVFGVFGRSEVLKAVNDVEWQTLRLCIKGEKMSQRKKLLEEYLENCDELELARIRVTNYIYALKRGGMFTHVD